MCAFPGEGEGGCLFLYPSATGLHSKRDCVSDRYSLPRGASSVSDLQGFLYFCTSLSPEQPGVQVFRNQNINIHEQLELARYWGPLHKHATTPIPKEPGLEEVHGSFVRFHPPSSSLSPPPKKKIKAGVKPHENFSKLFFFTPNSRVQYIFPAYRPFPKRRSLAL